jgi:hypothetical protein
MTALRVSFGVAVLFAVGCSGFLAFRVGHTYGSSSAGQEGAIASACLDVFDVQYGTGYCAARLKNCAIHTQFRSTLCCHSCRTVVQPPAASSASGCTDALNAKYGAGYCTARLTHCAEHRMFREELCCHSCSKLAETIAKPPQAKIIEVAKPPLSPPPAAPNVMDSAKMIAKPPQAKIMEVAKPPPSPPPAAPNVMDSGRMEMLSAAFGQGVSAGRPPVSSVAQSVARSSLISTELTPCFSP